MKKEKIIRIDTYDDNRFNKESLNQHGCYEINGKSTVEITIISSDSASLKGDEKYYKEVIDEFRYYAKHITKFFEKNGDLIFKFPKVDVFKIGIEKIRPLQFFVDRDKLKAIKTFVNSEKDIIVPLVKENDEFLLLDGHTRLFYAYEKGFKYVYGYFDEPFNGYEFFVEETKKRGIKKASDLILLNHNEYDEMWIKFCDKFYEEYEKSKPKTN